jgi:hypothetical protein
MQPFATLWTGLLLFQSMGRLGCLAAVRHQANRHVIQKTWLWLDLAQFLLGAALLGHGSGVI